MFKQLFLLIAVSFLPLFSTLSAAEKSDLPVQEKDWVAGPDKTWYLHYDTALAAAQKQHKLVYVLRTGSDWCGWCIKLRQDVFSTNEFRRFAKKNLILLFLDSPKKQLPESQAKHNQIVSGQLQFGGGVPCAKVLSEDGKVLGTIGGYMNKKEYLEALEKIVREKSSGADAKEL